ncbi:hypothetical protein LMG28138_00531 [Pararobbsia alpina]|uniref:Uncharacterized protein n=1 Tax=Pararobbsia alpina TaxID=621374 RepID=A0A6S7AUN6_9BURK|nr:hypothetical protein LMG28138_00531 [Pararobbsia alpina]
MTWMEVQAEAGQYDKTQQTRQYEARYENECAVNLSWRMRCAGLLV